ncbi:hypothetical protein C9374_006901 [Naegleria lovaniensis]|uniref:Uncharacterized protein n=1 Tax=Naegleria lovaniensis TaxID=51637 RepID=A0AA88KXQ2_NAELO|nr:uncharacterized protein C9374_006901 [Naegleria lovaniensis]KAG2393370.1 hypothetical protein C9374_006901 [Naegleria lovaniensis]
MKQPNMCTSSSSRSSSVSKNTVGWFDYAQECILEEVIKQNHGKPFTMQETEQAQELMKLLSTSADTKGIKFSSTALHYQYYQSKFKKRALLMYQVLVNVWKTEFLTSFKKKASAYNERTVYEKVKQLVEKKKGQWNFNEFSELATLALILSTRSNDIQVNISEDTATDMLDGECNHCGILSIPVMREFTDVNMSTTQRHIRIASIGGGPGNDSAAFVVLKETLLAKLFEKGVLIESDLFDLEKNWKNYLEKLQEISKDSLILNFNRCDVTKSLENSLNRALKDRISDYDIFLFSYVCNETSHLTKQAEGVFFTELFTYAKPFSIFVFIDVIDHAKKALMYIEELTRKVHSTFVSFHLPSNQAQEMIVIKCSV